MNENRLRPRQPRRGVGRDLRSLLLGLMTCIIAGESLAAGTAPDPTRGTVGILLVSHGSHSKNWRTMLEEVGTHVARELREDAVIGRVRSAFMEYTEPSIATQLKAFDADGVSNIVVVPVLLTVSGHSFDDIPIIAGQREDRATQDRLAMEKIEVYRPKARVTFTPLLDFPRVLEANAVRRVRQMAREPGQEGVVLVAYGDETYNDEWEELMRKVGKALKEQTGVAVVNHSWCGHIVRYQGEPTEKAIREVLETRERALVVPVLVAVDETFQGRIIGGAIEKVAQPSRIVYRHDSVLPDENVNRWLVDIAREYARKYVQP